MTTNRDNFKSLCPSGMGGFVFDGRHFYPTSEYPIGGLSRKRESFLCATSEESLKTTALTVSVLTCDELVLGPSNMEMEGIEFWALVGMGYVKDEWKVLIGNSDLHQAENLKGDKF